MFPPAHGDSDLARLSAHRPLVTTLAVILTASPFAEPIKLKCNLTGSVRLSDPSRQHGDRGDCDGSWVRRERAPSQHEAHANSAPKLTASGGRAAIGAATAAASSPNDSVSVAAAAPATARLVRGGQSQLPAAGYCVPVMACPGGDGPARQLGGVTAGLKRRPARASSQEPAETGQSGVKQHPGIYESRMNPATTS
jgi:hypothetical protein